MAIDINRLTAGVELPQATSREVWASAQEASAVMRLATKINLPGNGVSVPMITGDATAAWVEETDEKPVSRNTFGNKSMTAHKLAVIVPMSNEFKRDASSLYNEVVRRLPAALGARFDATVLAGATGPAGIDTLFDAQTADLAADTYAGLVEADALVGAAGGVINGWALAPQGRSLLLGAVDGNQRPLFLNDASQGNVGNLLGAPVFQSKAVYVADADGAGTGTAAQVGIAGDWTQAYYGTVEGIRLDATEHATLNDGGTQINLWQRNMFAVRAEVEVGFVVRDKDAFVRLTA